MKKRILSCLMALALCLTLLPTAALAEEPEGTAQTSPAVEEAADPANGKAKQENQPAEQEEQQEDSATKQDEAVAAVQAMIDALPDAAELDGMDDADAMAVYEAFQTACDAYYDTLTEGQQAQLKNTEKLAALSEWFSQSETLAEGDTHTDHPICGKTCSHTGEDGRPEHPDNAFANAKWLASYSGKLGVEASPGSSSDESLPNDGNYVILKEGCYYLSTTADSCDHSYVQSDKTIKIQGNVTICLNGKTIQSKDKGMPVFEIVSGGTLTLTDCQGNKGKVTRAYNTPGGGVEVNGGTFNLYGGSITKNTAAKGGGVYVSGGTFNMYGGEIAYNKSEGENSSGGGVYVVNGTFTMSGGTISGNEANNGADGGVGVYNNATFKMSGGKINATELVGAIISQADSLVEGLKLAQEKIKGSMTILLLTPEGIYISRDRLGRTPAIIGRKDGAFCVSFESFAYINLGYTDYKELGPGEIVRMNADGVEVLSPARKEMKICSFLWVYYGYPTSCYEGINVEEMRYHCGRMLAKRDQSDADLVAGIPDSGIAHAVGYANESGIPFARPFIKYTPTWPRSFMPTTQSQRNLIARMKLIPVDALIRDKSLLLIDDSIVRGTQLGETTEFLYQSGAKAVHIRPACPPLLFGCKYLNFSRSNSELDLITRRIIRDREGDNISPELLDDYANPDSQNYKEMVEEIRKRLNFTSLQFHRLDDLIESIGLEPCKLCTYCWNGKE